MGEIASVIGVIELVLIVRGDVTDHHLKVARVETAPNGAPRHPKEFPLGVAAVNPVNQGGDFDLLEELVAALGVGNAESPFVDGGGVETIDDVGGADVVVEALLNPFGEFAAQLGGEVVDGLLSGAPRKIAHNADRDRQLSDKRHNQNNPKGQRG
jgi:hypothetical protein